MTPQQRYTAKPNRICPKCKLRPALPTHSYCRECRNAGVRKYYKDKPQYNQERFKQRIKAIRTLVIAAKNRPCMDCGESFPYYVMDLDHVRGEKKFNLSVAASKVRAIATIQAEIDKCDVVCANCHRERTFTQGSSNR